LSPARLKIAAGEPPSVSPGPSSRPVPGPRSPAARQKTFGCWYEICNRNRFLPTVGRNYLREANSVRILADTLQCFIELPPLQVRIAFRDTRMPHGCQDRERLTLCTSGGPRYAVHSLRKKRPAAPKPCCSLERGHHKALIPARHVPVCCLTTDGRSRPHSPRQCQVPALSSKRTGESVSFSNEFDRSAK
jgi:hypothetical protein